MKLAILCFVFSLMASALFVLGISERNVRISGNYEIEWSGNRYACVDDYHLTDGFYRFKNLKNDKFYSISAGKIDNITDGCFYIKR